MVSAGAESNFSKQPVVCNPLLLVPGSHLYLHLNFTLVNITALEGTDFGRGFLLLRPKKYLFASLLLFGHPKRVSVSRLQIF